MAKKRLFTRKPVALSEQLPKSNVRRLKKPRYTSFRLEKRIAYKAPPTPGTIAILREALHTLIKHWRLIGGVAAIYAALYLILVRGIGGGIDFVTLKEEITTSMNDLISDGSVNSATTVLGLVSVLVLNPAAGQAQNAAANFYQAIILILFLLALIWTLRQLQSGKHFRIRDAYYRGMYPLVPFILILVVIAAQAVPLLFANLVLNIVRDAETPVALSLAEQVLWALFWFLMMLASVYMISGSIFALIIVTLADMTPLRALNGAYDLLRFRRFTVLRRVFVLMIIIVLGLGVVMVPTILWAVRFAGIVYTAWSVFSLTLLVTCLFVMYKRMLPRAN